MGWLGSDWRGSHRPFPPLLSASSSGLALSDCFLYFHQHSPINWGFLFGQVIPSPHIYKLLPYRSLSGHQQSKLLNMTQPTFVLVPGAWHRPGIYSRVMDTLGAHGYPTVGLPLPSAGAKPPNTSFDEDVNGIRDSLTKLVDTEEKEVILVVHSYTGMPGAEAPKGLGKKERQGKGLKGGVVRLVYIMAFAMPEGFQPTAGGAQMPEWMKLDLEVRSRSIHLLSAPFSATASGSRLRLGCLSPVC